MVDTGALVDTAVPNEQGLALSEKWLGHFKRIRFLHVSGELITNLEIEPDQRSRLWLWRLSTLFRMLAQPPV